MNKYFVIFEGCVILGPVSYDEASKYVSLKYPYSSQYRILVDKGIDLGD